MDWNIYSNGRLVRAIPYSGPPPGDGWELVDCAPDAELTLDAIQELQARLALPMHNF